MNDNPKPQETTSDAQPGLAATAGSAFEAFMEDVFGDAARMNQAQPADVDPYQSEEYQKFVASMVQYCHCGERHRPCDGVLAGGICDGIKDDRDDEYE